MEHMGEHRLVYDLHRRQTVKYVLAWTDNYQSLPRADGNAVLYVPSPATGGSPRLLGEADADVGGKKVGKVFLGEALALRCFCLARKTMVVYLMVAPDPPARDLVPVLPEP